MNIIIGSDHRGYQLKKKIIEKLKTLNYNVKDMGTYNEEPVDYPIYAFKVSEEVLKSNENVGILLCGSGIGMSIAANKVKGIRCAKVDNINEASLSKQHNNANVISISTNKTLDEILDIILTFLKSEFSKEERHIRRINEIENF